MKGEKVFLVRKGEIEGRFDSTAYKKAFNFTSAKFPIERLAKIAFIDPKLNFEKLDKDSEISFVPMEVISEHSGAIEELRSKKVSETKGFTRFQEDDLIWAKITPCMQNGKSAVARNLKQGFGCGSTEFYVIRPKSKDVSVDYLHLLLRDNRVLENAQNFFGGSAGQQRVSVDFLNNFQVPVPPIEIQTRIIEKFEAAYLGKREKETEAKSLLDGIDAYLLERLGIETPVLSEPSAVADGLNSSSESLPHQVQPSAIADGSDIVPPRKNFFYRRLNEVTGNRFDANSYSAERLSAIEAVKSGKYSFSKLKSLTDFSKTIVSETALPYIGMENIESNTGNYIAASEKESFGSAVAFSKHQILFPKLRPYLNKVYYAEFDGVCSTEFHILDSKNENLSNEFLSHFLRSRIIVSQTKHLMSGNTLPRLQTEDIENLLIPLPPPEVQEEIAAHIQSIRQRAKELEAEAKETVEQAKQEVERIILGE